MENTHPLYEKFLLRYFNKICGREINHLCDIPKESMDFLAYLKYKDLVRPFILRDKLERGLSLQALSQRYQLPRGYCQSVLRSAGVTS